MVVIKNNFWCQELNLAIFCYGKCLVIFYSILGNILYPQRRLGARQEIRVLLGHVGMQEVTGGYTEVLSRHRLSGGQIQSIASLLTPCSKNKINKALCQQRRSKLSIPRKGGRDTILRLCSYTNPKQIYFLMYYLSFRHTSKFLKGLVSSKICAICNNTL